MKKLIPLICFTLIIFFSVVCDQTGKSDNASINIGKSNKFSKDELNNAVTSVKDRFNKEFEGCTLNYLWYT